MAAAALAQTAPDLALESLKRVAIHPLNAPLAHVQGIDVEGSRLWISSVDSKARRGYLDLFDLTTGKRVARADLTRGEQFHPGGIAIQGESIWIPVAEYRRSSSSTIERRNKNTLALESSFEVADHIGCIAPSPGRLYGGNWDSREIYEWLPDGSLLRKRANPNATRYQDLKFREGRLIGSGVLSADGGAIDWLSPETLVLERRILTGKTDRGVRFTNEGMTVRGNLLYLAPEDGPSRVFVFELPDRQRWR